MPGILLPIANNKQTKMMNQLASKYFEVLGNIGVIGTLILSTDMAERIDSWLHVIISVLTIVFVATGIFQRLKSKPDQPESSKVSNQNPTSK